MRNVTFKLGQDATLTMSLPDRYETARGGASDDLERLFEVLVVATKQAGGTVTQERRTEIPL